MGQEALCHHNWNRQKDLALDTSHGSRSDITYKSLQNQEFLGIKNQETGNLKCRKIPGIPETGISVPKP